jgi:hypothetical protein
MTDPVLVAVPPKGGSFDDVLKRLVALRWLQAEFVTALRKVIKDDKRRVKLEEGLIALWRDTGSYEGTMRAADRAGHDLDEVDQALRRMRRWRDGQGREQVDYTDQHAVAAMVARLREDPDAEVRRAASCLHLQLDLTRPGKPVRMAFNQCDFALERPGLAPVRGVLMGTEHEVTPTWLRKHKRDISLTCYDAFHNTLLDVLDTGAVRNWRELSAHLDKTATAVRILGSLGLDDYLGHCVLMGSALAERTRVAGGGRRWDGPADPKFPILASAPLLIDPAYEEVYARVLDSRRTVIRFEAGPKDIEGACAEQGRMAIYIVRSGSTVAVTPGLCVVGEPLITSETIVAVNQERLERNPGVGVLVESLAPSDGDHTAAWQAKLAAKLGSKLV